MNHEYSTWTLVIIFGIIFIGAVVNSIDSGDMDILCDTNNSLIKKVAGTWVCSQTAYAEGYYHSYTTPIAITIGTADVYYNITGFVLNNSNQFITDRYYIETTKSGLYFISASMSFNGGNGGEYEVELFKNGTSQPDCSFFRTTSTTAIGDAGFTCLKYIEAGSELIMKIKDLSPPAQSVSIQRLNFNIIEVQ